MYRLFTALLLILILAAGATAQEEKTTGLIGKGGLGSLNMSNITGDDTEGAKMTAGFGIGGFAIFAMGPTIAIQPEIWYTTKGFKFELFDVDVDATFTYVEVPVLLKLSVPTQGEIKPNVFAGPYFAYLLSAEMGSLDISDEVKDSDLGLVFGAGVNYGAGEGLLTFDVRYSMGMNSFDDSEDDLDNKHTNLQFVAGYAF